VVNIRTQKIEETIRREIALIIIRLKDPRISKALVSVPKVRLSCDISSCKVFISTLKNFRYTSRIASVLQGASGFIGYELGKNSKIRRIPKIKFIATDLSLGLRLNTLSPKNISTKENKI
jgi:ribosome-binding factor A